MALNFFKKLAFPCLAVIIFSCAKIEIKVEKNFINFLPHEWL